MGELEGGDRDMEWGRDNHCEIKKGERNRSSFNATFHSQGH